MTEQPSSQQAPSTALPRWKRVLFGSLLFLFVIGLGEVVAILYLRAFHGYDGRHLYQYAYDPYKNILPAPGYVDTRGVRHNSAGFRRSTEVSRAKPAGTYRVFLMGASTAYGLGGLWGHIERGYPVLKNEHTLDAYLERRLQAELRRPVEVINAAITSTWTHHNLIYLNQTVLKYDPDMVLFLDGYNDFFYFDSDFDQFGSYSYNLPGRVVLGDPTMYSLAYGVGWWMFRQSALVHVLGRGARVAKLLVSPRPERTPLRPDTALARMQRNFTANALQMQRRSGLILRDAGVHAVFMLQPILVLERDRQGATEVERRLLQFNLDSYRPGYEEYMLRAVPFVRAAQQRMASDVGAQYLDLTTTFKNVNEQVYTDYAHMTPRGNELLAERIAAHILPLIGAARDEVSAPAQQRQPASR